MSTEQQRQEWARLAEAATPGEWVVEQHSGILHEGAPSTCAVLTTEEYDLASFGDSEQAMFDATFIAASRAAIPALLADVDRLTGDNAALSEALDTALLHLKESEADRDKAIAELAQVRAQLEEQGAEIDRLRRAIEDEHGCTPGEFDPFTFHEGPLFEY
jgi:hypothetical protein